MEELRNILQSYRDERSEARKLRITYLDGLSLQDKVIKNWDIKIKEIENAIKKLL